MAQPWDRNQHPHRRLRKGARGDDVTMLQKAINVRRKRRGQPSIAVDGDLGHETGVAFRAMGHRLGFRHPFITVNHQRFMRWPWERPKGMVARGKLRERKLSAGTKPDRALRWAASKIGTVESPAGSNRGPGITGWQQSFGSWLVGQAWCGVFVGFALRLAGVKGITSRVAAVAFIEDDARAGRNGFRSWHGRHDGHRGDAVVIGGRGVHVELIEKRVPGGYQTIGGNTSSGNSGSQSNGGGCWRRYRSYGAVHGCARPRY